MIKNISFEKILPTWKTQLWPGRESAIEPLSALNQQGKVDMEIFKQTPHFFGYYENNQLVGVNSCHRTSDNALRSRGLWVHPDFRNKGIASKLILHVFAFAKENEIPVVWTMARHSAAEFYLRLGFTKYAETSEFEFGPHTFVEVRLEF